MALRDIRTVNATEGQKIENDTVMKRIGDISIRNMGILSQMSLFNEGKALVMGDGLRVEPSSGMTVNVPSGSVFQRFTEVIPCIQTTAQTVTLDAADGVARTDIIEAKVVTVTDKDDMSLTATVASGSAVSITNETIKRDIKYYLSVRKQKGTTTPTAATSGTLTGTVAISGTIDLSETYLINMADGEDGSYQEIDLRGATPEATTRTEIINNINAAVGRTMATTGAGDVIVLTGTGSGETSYFQIKPPVTDSDKDALYVVFGVSIGGVYKYTYQGSNEWFKIAEIDVGTSTTTITTALIRNIDKKDTWTGEVQDIIVHDPIYKKNVAEWTKYDASATYDQWDVAYIGDMQFVSLLGSNSGNYPVTSPNYWKKSPSFEDILEDYQEGRVKDSGGKNIHDSGSGDYEQWFFIGNYENDNRVYTAYGIHLDGTQITGDSNLESILRVDESDEYFALDIWGPDDLGTRTLLDTRACVKSYNDGGVLREDIGVRQVDSYQDHNHVIDVYDSTLAGGNNGQPPSGGQNLIAQPSTSGGSSGNPEAETRMKNWSDGIPFLVILKQIS